MLPFGTQIAFTCNQPRNFALWCDSKPIDNLNPEVTSLVQAYEHVANTKGLLGCINVGDEKLNEFTHIDLGEGLYIEMFGRDYVNDFLIPNFYFHYVFAFP
ncbi:MAG: DUF1993 family protein [Cyanobacteria bacterium J06639_18]